MRITFLALALLSLAGSSSATLYSLRDDFSASSNPTGPWAYGSVSGLGGGFAANTLFTDTYYGMQTWVFSAGESYPLVLRNHTGADVTTWSTVPMHAGDVGLHPGNGINPAAVRFVAPFEGSYAINSLFDSLGGATVSVGVYRNQSLVDSSTLGGSGTWAYGSTLLLAAGEALDFVVGSNGGYVNDSTRLDVTLDATPVPEPVSGLALALGVFAVRRRRN